MPKKIGRRDFLKQSLPAAAAGIGGWNLLLSGAQKEQGGEPPYEIRLEYRALHPGEAIKVILKTSRSLRRALLSFGGDRMDMANMGSFWMALLGLDLNLTPGNYSLNVYLIFPDGSEIRDKKEILVIPFRFPEKKLWVDQKFVTPPASELERIRRESKLVASVFAIRTIEWLGKGPFILPSQGKVNPNFGERRFFNNEPRSPHSGVDISSPHGDPVIAANSGHVVLANHLYYAGKTVIIDHGMGVFSFYGHFSQILVSRGDPVKRGEIIGKIGATGRVTGPHLHWSVRIRGARVDPLSLISLDLE